MRDELLSESTDPSEKVPWTLIGWVEPIVLMVTKVGYALMDTGASCRSTSI